jgi:hypothetical protein
MTTTTTGDDLMNTQHELAEARKAVERTKKVEAEALAAVNRGKRVHEAAQTMVGEVAKTFAVADAEQASAVAAQLTAGKPMKDLPQAISHDGLEAELLAAKRQENVAKGALTSLTRTHANAMEETKAAQASLRLVVQDALSVDERRLAKEVRELEDQAVSKRIELLALEAAFDGSGFGRRWSPEQATLEALQAPGDFSPPRHAAGLLFSAGPHKALIEAARLRWVERIAQLKAGDTAAPEKAA